MTLNGLLTGFSHMQDKAPRLAFSCSGGREIRLGPLTLMFHTYPLLPHILRLWGSRKYPICLSVQVSRQTTPKFFYPLLDHI